MRHLLALASLLLVAGISSAETLVTDTYKIKVGSCPEGHVTCSEVQIEVRQRNADETSTYTGETLHSTCADGVTPCRFQGYRFNSNMGQVMLYVDGTLDVNDESGQIVLVEKGVWDYQRK